MLLILFSNIFTILSEIITELDRSDEETCGPTYVLRQTTVSRGLLTARRFYRSSDSLTTDCRSGMQSRDHNRALRVEVPMSLHVPHMIVSLMLFIHESSSNGSFDSESRLALWHVHQKNRVMTMKGLGIFERKCDMRSRDRSESFSCVSWKLKWWRTGWKGSWHRWGKRQDKKNRNDLMTRSHSASWRGKKTTIEELEAPGDTKSRNCWIHQRQHMAQRCDSKGTDWLPIASADTKSYEA
jgi:hypothetical protein